MGFGASFSRGRPLGWGPYPDAEPQSQGPTAAVDVGNFWDESR